MTEPKYFEAFIRHFNISQGQVKVIPHEKTKSSPNQVIEYVIDFEKQVRKSGAAYADSYQYWLVLDTDRWEQNLSSVISDAYSRKYDMAQSNPCFEIWKLLHFEDISQNISSSYLANKTSINGRLASLHKSGNLEIEYFPRTEDAISNAKQLDTNPNERQLVRVGTRVYRLVELLFEYRI